MGASYCADPVNFCNMVSFWESLGAFFVIDGLENIGYKSPSNGGEPIKTVGEEDVRIAECLSSSSIISGNG